MVAIPARGGQIQKSVYGDTQAEVRKKLQQVCVDLDEGVYAEPSKLTLSAWLDIWLAEYTGQSEASFARTVQKHD